MKKLLSLILITISLFAFAQTSTANKKINYNVNSNNVGIEGYDPVAYFTKNKAIKGDSKIQTKYDNVIYHFATQEDKKIFDANPIKYIPQYGGWCAYAVGANGKKVEINPSTFKILDGKLYLFYNKNFTNTLPKWNKDEANLKKKADENWKKIK